MNIEQTFDIYEAKQNVKSALAATSEWRKAAAEDFAFMQGKQWQDSDLKNMYHLIDSKLNGGDET